MSDPIHIARYGRGPRVFVGFHGWGSEHHKSFRDMIDLLPDDVTLYGVDMPGCGKSAQPEDWSWEAIHDQVAAALDAQLPDSPWSLIGACAGSYHALEITRRMPERVQQNLLLEPFAYMPWFFSIFLAPLTGELLYYTVFDSPIGRKATQMSLKRQGVSADYDMLEAFGAGDMKIPYRYLQAYGQIDSHQRFAGCDAPVTRVLYGANTWRAIIDSVPLWRELWPDLVAHRLEGAGHWFLKEASSRAAAHIFDPRYHPAPQRSSRPYGHGNSSPNSAAICTAPASP